MGEREQQAGGSDSELISRLVEERAWNLYYTDDDAAPSDPKWPDLTDRQKARWMQAAEPVRIALERFVERSATVGHPDEGHDWIICRDCCGARPASSPESECECTMSCEHAFRVRPVVSRVSEDKPARSSSLGEKP